MSHNPTHDESARPLAGTNRDIATRLIVSVLTTIGAITLLTTDVIPGISHALIWCLLVVAVPTGVVAASILTTRAHKQLRQRRTATADRTQHI